MNTFLQRRLFFNPLLTNNYNFLLFTQRSFGYKGKKVGSNNNLVDEKREYKKYGMKRRFYDHLPQI